MSETKSMLIYASDWQGQESLRMLPVTEDCPFNEVIFDPTSRVLAVISKDQKEKPQMLPKLNSNGQMIMIKGLTQDPKNPHQPSYVEERQMMDAYYEYYMDNQDDINTFIELFAINPTHPSVDIVAHVFNPATPA